MTDPVPSEFQQEEPAQLKFLRRLITTLTAVMICGLVVVVALLVIRLSDDGPDLPENIALPDGIEAKAVTFGEGWIAVVTADDRILVLNNLTGQIQQEILIKSP
ncbi:DUF6476 family protein [Epibacterium ulvae]|uniref:DUF6476 family protein n=1 Tax=Epibacterium ulvae TaxID=1156985 RepID=UPI0024927F29|nr:DUF6476 family protein [Epibacterium ulvae]